jgi:AcrR family transcriptional regulator
MPRLWEGTVNAHRHQVRDAILNTTAALVTEHGLLGVTMSQIAEQTGIGRATLYKYFPDVEAILHAWHERQIAAHLQQLARVRDEQTQPRQRLAAVLAAFAQIAQESRGHRDTELAALLHSDKHVASAQQHLHDMIGQLIEEGATAGWIRADVTAGELASYCLHALTAATTLQSKAALRRLVAVTLAGLEPERSEL